jgi:hypothetical protein
MFQTYTLVVPDLKSATSSNVLIAYGGNAIHPVLLRYLLFLPFIG